MLNADYVELLCSLTKRNDSTLIFRIYCKEVWDCTIVKTGIIRKTGGPLSFTSEIEDIETEDFQELTMSEGRFFKKE